MLAPLPTAHPRVSPEQLQARGSFLMGTDPSALPWEDSLHFGVQRQTHPCTCEFSRSLSAASDRVLWLWSLPVTDHPDAVL